MSELLKSININDTYKELNVPDHIIRHMTKVASICLMFDDNLTMVKSNEMIIAALCHDILKLKGPNHEDKGGSYFEKKGYKTIAKIITKHKYTSIADQNPEKRPNTIEEKTVYYADKRVMHDQIVSIKERLADGRLRYPQIHSDIEKDKKIEQKILDLEAELCSEAGIVPSDISDQTLKPYIARIKRQFLTSHQ